MRSSIIANFYERDLNRLLEELRLFQNEEHLWRTQGSITNAAGNLVLHLIGGLNYLIGAKLGGTGYVRDRNAEFSRKGVPRAELVAPLEALIPLIARTIASLTDEQMEADYPIPFDDAVRSNSYVLVQLLAHLNYHLGQVNYLRRML